MRSARTVLRGSAIKTTKSRILVIEDHDDLAQLIKMHLEQDLPGEVAIVSDGSAGLDEAISGNYDLMVLDLRLPGVDGLTICREARAVNDTVPIVVVTAKSSETDRIIGLELGADDYISKPFHIGEFVARIRAVLRRAGKTVHSRLGALSVRDVSMDPATRRVVVAGREITLTRKEFDLLHLLASHPDTVFTRAQLLETVWKTRYSGYGHSVDCHVNRLRTKLGPAKSGQLPYIVAVWGVGYKFAD